MNGTGFVQFSRRFIIIFAFLSQPPKPAAKGKPPKSGKLSKAEKEKLKKEEAERKAKEEGWCLTWYQSAE